MISFNVENLRNKIRDSGAFSMKYYWQETPGVFNELRQFSQSSVGEEFSFHTMIFFQFSGVEKDIVVLLTLLNRNTNKNNNKLLIR